MSLVQVDMTLPQGADAARLSIEQGAAGSHEGAIVRRGGRLETNNLPS
jgi:hypothetical protein